MSLSYERHRVIDFSFPYLVDRITFAVRPPQLLDPADAIVRPFSPEVRLVNAYNHIKHACSMRTIEDLIVSLFVKFLSLQLER